MGAPPPIRSTCSYCQGTGIRTRQPRGNGECRAVWWDMTSEPFTEWTCGRPLAPGARHCLEHERQIAFLAEQRSP
jgi:hypothetical protein